MISSPYAILYCVLAYQLLQRWIARGKAQWERKLKTFAADHHGVIVEGDPEKRLLFVVVPSSGAGKAMECYPECMRALQQRKERFTIEVYVTKSSLDVQTLVEGRRSKVDISEYCGIIMLSGDSSITELIQAPLRANKGKWKHPPILHLPGGTTNLLSKELFRGKPMHEILSEFSIDTVKRASVIEVSSPGSSPVYATHVAIQGLGRHMLMAAEGHRSGLYAVFGKIILPFIMLPMIFSPPNKNESPYFSMLIASTKNFAGGNDSGFDLDLFDNKLLMLHVVQYEGGLHYIQNVLGGMFSGDLARWYKDSKLPKGLEVKLENRFDLDDHDFHFVLDGTTTVALKGKPVSVECLGEALPYFVL